VRRTDKGVEAPFQKLDEYMVIEKYFTNITYFVGGSTALVSKLSE